MWGFSPARRADEALGTAMPFGHARWRTVGPASPLFTGMTRDNLDEAWLPYHEYAGADVKQSATSAAAAPATTSTISSSSEQVPAHQHSSACDSPLWKHVYHPCRLHVISECKTVRRTVEEVRWEPDGDLHILLRTSPSLVNADNRAYEHGDLVPEVICKGTVTQADVVAAPHLPPLSALSA